MADMSDTSEKSKRKREIISQIPLGIIFILLAWFQFYLFSISETLPFHYGMFFFGLVNINLIIFLILLFLIFRNLTKLYSETKIPIFGKTLKSKLMIAFFTFAFIPTALMFLVSIFYINSSFDRWFAIKGMGILDDSIQITELYYKNLKKENYFLSSIFSKEILGQKITPNRIKKLKSMLSESPVEAVEIYDLQKKKRWTIKQDASEQWVLPEMEWEEFQNAHQNSHEDEVFFSKNIDIESGRLIRTLSIKKDSRYVVVANQLIPFFLVEQINNIIESRDNYRSTTPFEFPLKSIYLIILILMTLVILLGGTWFALYLAGQLSSSLEKLGQATQDISRGEYKKIDIPTGSYEVESLVKNFNTMAHRLKLSKSELETTNDFLKNTLVQLQESKNYIQTIVENISSSMISVNVSGDVTLINKAALKFFDLDHKKYSSPDTHIPIQDILPENFFQIFEDLKKRILEDTSSVVTSDKRVIMNNAVVNLKCALSCLRHDSQEILGFIFAFEDITPLAKAQRAQAWTEVATRVAHEIKNPLTPIRLSAERLRKKYPNLDESSFNQCTQMIIQQVDLVKNLVDEFSYHARLPRLNLIRDSINKALKENIWIYNKMRNLKIELIPDPNIPDSLFDPDQLKRILINILDNASDALIKAPFPKVCIYTRLVEEGKRIEIRVVDNGPGIPKKHLQDVFRSNFTTKPKGSGLGLSIVKKMVEEHSGQIFVESVPGETCFTIIWPVDMAMAFT